MAQTGFPSYFEPFFQPCRYKGLYGGRGSGKSHCFAGLMVIRAANEHGFRGVCVREIQKSIADSSKQLIEDKIDEYGLQDFFVITDNEIRGVNGSKIIFRGMQNHTANTIKSLEGYDVAWIEEAHTITEFSLTILTPTIRKPGSEIWASWNPNSPKDAVDSFFRNIPDDEPEEDIMVQQVNFYDNPWFPDELRKDMLRDKRRDPDKYANVWEGQYWGRSNARIFNNFEVGTREVPENVVWFYGVDWGFADDPMAGVRACILDEETLYIESEFVEHHVPTERLPSVVNRLPDAKLWPIRADNARPESIDHCKRHGFPKMRRCKKGKGSVEEGISYIQSFDVVINPACPHTLEEFRGYKYVVDKEGNVTRKPVDKDNHCIDALRYGLEKAPRRDKTTKRPPKPPEPPKRPDYGFTGRVAEPVGSWKTV